MYGGGRRGGGGLVVLCTVKVGFGRLLNCLWAARARGRSVVCRSRCGAVRCGAVDRELRTPVLDQSMVLTGQDAGGDGLAGEGRKECSAVQCSASTASPSTPRHLGRAWPQGKIGFAGESGLLSSRSSAQGSTYASTIWMEIYLDPANAPALAI